MLRESLGPVEAGNDGTRRPIPPKRIKVQQTESRNRLRIIAR